MKTSQQQSDCQTMMQELCEQVRYSSEEERAALRSRLEFWMRCNFRQ